MNQPDHLINDLPGQPLSFHPVIRLGAKVVSLLFHPLFIPVYLTWFLITVNPLFAVFDAHGKWLLLIRFFVMYTLFPLVTILLARGLGFVQSIYLKTQRDRIIPYVACGIYYFWMWYVLRNQSEFPQELILLSLAIFIASSMGLLANNYLKVSMHAIAAGVMVTYMLLLGFLLGGNMGVYISMALLSAGLICTARLINNDHTTAEVYTGLFIGIIAQLISYWSVRGFLKISD